jgi:hypothetical protein
MLNKYEKYALIAKDEYIAELVFKYEKNLKYHQTFDSKGRTLIVEMNEVIE